jgi:hypothetical protein
VRNISPKQRVLNESLALDRCTTCGPGRSAGVVEFSDPFTEA